MITPTLKKQHYLKFFEPKSSIFVAYLETVAIAVLVTLISITFNIPPAEALTILDQWIAAFLQLATSTGLIALIEFWRQVIWQRIYPTAGPVPPKS